MSEIRRRALEMERIDTHSHFCGQDSNLRELGERFEAYESRMTKSDARIVAEGCRRLYGIDPGAYIRPDSPDEVFTRAAELHDRGVVEAFLHSLDLCRITTQLGFTGYDPAEDKLLQGLVPRMKFLAYIDNLICGDDHALCPAGKKDDFCYYEALCGRLGDLNMLEDYFDGIDQAIDGWRQHNIVGMKTALAYTIGLNFSDPSRDDAETAFAKKGNMSYDEMRLVQDFAFRHALLACKRNGLPVVIHTGGLAWGLGSLANSNPMLLHPILVDERYEGITFVLLHGGMPAYTGETTYLGRVLPNVIIDFTAVPWVFRTRARTAMAEWMEAIPDNRFCWGSDSTTVETVAGIDAVSREVIADVLEDLITRRTIDERAALTFLENTYLNTPKRVFGL